MRFAFTAILLMLSMQTATAAFQSPESVVRNVYAHYGNGSAGLSGGLLHDEETSRNFFDPGLQKVWVAATKPPYDFFVQSPSWKIGPVTIEVTRTQFDRTYVAANFDNNAKPVSLNFIVVKTSDGWVIYDVETTHDSLRLFLQQLKD